MAQPLILCLMFRARDGEGGPKHETILCILHYWQCCLMKMVKLIYGHHPHLNPEYPENYPEYLENLDYPENPEYLENWENPESPEN